MTRPRGFAPWRPQRRTLPLLDAIRSLLNEYAAHLPLTLRQVLYLLAARLIVAKTPAGYAQVGNVLSRARRARLVPMAALRDDSDDLPASLLEYDCADDLGCNLAWQVEQFRLDPQLGQERRVLVASEHAGLKPQIRTICDPFGVHVIAGGGFDSLTTKHGLAELLADAETPFTLLHIGDLDRYGEDIFNSLIEDVAAFGEELGGDCEFARLAVTPEQVELYDLPSDPDKPQ
jgi:hypothetical protein